MPNAAVVGTLRAILSADTAEFASAMRKASDVSEQTAKDVTKTGAAFAALEPRMASVSRLVRDFSGSFERRGAEEFALAIDKIGGAAKLSESELRRAQGVFTDFLSKAKALGQEVPPHIAKLSSEIDKLHPSTTKATQGVGILETGWKKLAAAFSAGLLIERAIRGLVDFAREAVATAGRLVDLSNKTGLGIESLQRFEFVASQTGTSLDSFSTAAFKLGTNLTTGGKKVEQAVAALGLSVTQLRNLKPDEQFDLVAKALGSLTNVQERNTLGVALMGKGYAELAPAIQDYRELVGQAAVASEQSVRAIDDAADAVSRFADAAQKEATRVLGTLILLIEKRNEAIKPGERRGSLIRELTEEEQGARDLANALSSSYLNAVRTSAQATQSFSVDLQNAIQEIQGLTAAERKEIDAALKLGKTWDDLPPKLQLSEQAQKIYSSTVKEGTKALSENEQQYRKWADTVTGAALQRDVTELTDNLRRLTKEGRLSGDAFEAITKQAIALEAKGAKLDPTLDMIVHRFIRFDKEGKSFFETFAKGGDVVEKFTVDLIEFNQEGQSFFETFGPMARVTETFTVDAKKAAGSTRDWTAELKTASEIMFEVSNAFSQMGSAIGGEAGRIVSTIGDIAEGIGRLASGDIIGGVTRLLGVLTQFKTLGRNIARDMQDAFATSELGFENLAALNQHLRDLGAVDLVNAGDRAQRKDDEAATRRWMEDVKKFLDDIERLAALAFDHLLKAAEDFGGKAPAALQPFLRELLNANALTKEQRDLLEGLAGAPEWEQLQAIAQKYGIELGALGQSFQDARIGDMALQYARDFMTLRDAGGDVNGLLIGMQDEVQALVNDALKFGTAIPEALRPVLQGLLEMGLLTDENGNKLEDLSRFSFTGTLEDAFKDMKSILEEIRDLLAGGLPKAAHDGGQQVEDEFTGAFDRIRQKAKSMTVTVPVEFSPGAFTPPSGFGVNLPQMQEGGVTRRGGIFELHPNEAVIPLDSTNAPFDIRNNVNVFLDGRQITEGVVTHMREVGRRLGVRPI